MGIKVFPNDDDDDAFLYTVEESVLVESTTVTDSDKNPQSTLANYTSRLGLSHPQYDTLNRTSAGGADYGVLVYLQRMGSTVGDEWQNGWKSLRRISKSCR